MLRWLRARIARAWRYLKWPASFAAAIVFSLLLPVGYIELRCRGTPGNQAYQPLITDPAQQRREANTYLTYPEWHIVYAYDGLAEALKSGDEFRFDYGRSVAGFWSSTCALMRVADAHGGADFGTRSMIHTIGVSFTAELAIKAAYEETIGRAFAWLRGADKSPQDRAVSEMAADYSQFLRQTPWYRYPFMREAGRLWSTPTGGTMRGWERRFGIGAEFVAKAAYANLLAGAAAADPAPLTIRSVIGGFADADLRSIADVTIIGPRGAGIEIDTPRYDRFTRILAEIARRGGTILEIAGNDDIMVTLTVPRDAVAPSLHGSMLYRMLRDGFPGDRLIVDVKVSDLAGLLRQLPLGDPGVEHIFDY